MTTTLHLCNLAFLDVHNQLRIEEQNQNRRIELGIEEQVPTHFDTRIQGKIEIRNRAICELRSNLGEIQRNLFLPMKKTIYDALSFPYNFQEKNLEKNGRVTSQRDLHTQFANSSSLVKLYIEIFCAIYSTQKIESKGIS